MRTEVVRIGVVAEGEVVDVAVDIGVGRAKEREGGREGFGMCFNGKYPRLAPDLSSHYRIINVLSPQS